MNRDQLLRILAYHHTPFEGCDHEAVADDVMAALAAGGSSTPATPPPADGWIQFQVRGTSIPAWYRVDGKTVRWTFDPQIAAGADTVRPADGEDR